MKEWISTCMVYVILLTILMELLPKGSFRKYLKLMGGCIFLIFVFQMVFGNEKVLPLLYQKYYQKMEQTMNSKDGKAQIIEEYKQQAEQQIKDYLENQGYEISDVKVKVSEENVEEIVVTLKNADAYEKGEIEKKLSEVYSDIGTHINVKS